MMTAAALTGRSIEHIAQLDEPQCSLHAEVVAPFLAMRTAALSAGIELTPVSSFRDFERQLLIWNEKFVGKRPVLDLAGQPVDMSSLSPAQRVTAILHWSALPGASRHHWGTDLDLIDSRRIGPDHRLQLTPAEFSPGGPFAESREWLERHAREFGFFRPYRGVLSGVAAEPWHWSYARIAEPARLALSRDVLALALEPAPLRGKAYVMKQLDALHSRFVADIDPPSAEELAAIRPTRCANG